MEQQSIELPIIQLVGITAKTKTSFQKEGNLETAQIGPLVEYYFSNGIFDQIPSRAKPMVTYSAYFDYDSDEYGEYRYFIGEEVSEVGTLPEGLTTLTIPTGRYEKFTSPRGAMPGVVIEAWQHIWQLDEAQLKGLRQYVVDFEIYDERAADPQNTIVDCYVGMK